MWISVYSAREFRTSAEVNVIDLRAFSWPPRLPPRVLTPRPPRCLAPCAPRLRALKVFHRPCRRIFGACLLDTPNWVLLVRSLAYFFVNFNRSCKVRKNCVSSFDLHGNSMHVSPTFPFRLIFILRHVSNCGVTGFRANFFLDSKWTWPEMRDMRLSCTAATWGVPVNYIHARLTSVSDVIKKW
jgi:hypothetical protein